MSLPKVAVLTGGTGFIGSRVARRLLAEGWQVRILSASGRREALGKQAVAVSWHSVGDADIEKAITGAMVYFNFAVAYDRPSVSDEILQRVNVDLPCRVMTALRKAGGMARCVLGDSFFRKFPPEATAQGRYTRSKTDQWTMAQALAAGDRLAVAMLRIEQVYGPGETLTKAFPSVVARLLRQEPRIALTQGLQRRDFVHVDDVADAALVVAQHHAKGATVIDCGSGSATPVREVFLQLHALTGSSSTLGFGDYPADQTIDSSQADLTWLEQAGWRPRISLSEGLRQLVDDVRARVGD
ncbi:hypothetical protein CLD22_11065 [Rubrivivax gelatinosus]|nr:hypothetical protein [Rubrivivax gelatinosus]